MTRPTPSRALEDTARAAGYTTIAYVDECGRGSAAGPLVVCAVLTPPEISAPAGLADSKLITARQRGRLEPLLVRWVTGCGYGVVTAEEIDRWGMSHALRVAAHRALNQLPIAPDLVILDGPHDYIRAPYVVWARAKADQTETGVAAASVLGKTYRDRRMRELDDRYPGYGFSRNVGYLSAQHRHALRELGPTPEHRTTWKYMDDLPQWSHLRRTPDLAPAVPTLPT